MCKQIIAIGCEKLLSCSFTSTDSDLKVVSLPGEASYGVRYCAACFDSFSEFLKAD